MQPQVFYYYNRDEQQRPIITVCFITDGVRHARGIAYCSVNDNPCKTTGRKLAWSRAKRAWHSNLPVWSFSDDAKYYKATNRPDPTAIEKKFIAAAQVHNNRKAA